MNHFREVLREARTRAGLTQKELAAKVGIDDSSISKMEKGVFLPVRKIAVGLADALGISDPEKRNNFLIAAGVFNDEDYEGYTLVKVAGGPSVKSKQQTLTTTIHTVTRAAKSIRGALFGTKRKEFNDLIDSAHLTDEEDEKVFAALVEIAKPILALIKHQQKEGDDEPQDPNKSAIPRTSPSPQFTERS